MASRHFWPAAPAAVLATVVLIARPSAATTIVVPDDVATLQAALDAAAAGDTVSVKDTASPYHEKISFPTSGATGAYITLQAFPGHSPVIDGTGVPGSNMVLIDTQSYVKLIGFEIRNDLGVHDGSGVRILGSGSHIEIRDNRIHDIRGSDAMGITVYGTQATSISDLIIDGNHIYDCEPAHSEALTLNGNVELFQVTNNIVRDVNNIGIDFIGGETDIQPNSSKVVRNGVCSGNQVSRARSIYGGGFAGGIYVDGGKDIVIAGNRVTESDLGIEIGAENAGITTTGVIVRDNLVYRNDKAGIVFGGFDASVGRVKDSFFLNNSCFQNDTLGEGLGELWIQFASDNAIRNNIFYSTAQNVLMYSENGNVNNALDYNLWFADAGAAAATFVWQNTAYTGFGAYRSGSGQDANGQFADPRFVNAAAADFHLRSSSPAVNAGDPGFVPAGGETDIDGAPRVSGGRVDAGADEVTCGNTIIDPGELCDDGNLTDCDGCDSNCTPSSTCGNGIACAPEQCDDGNTVNGDCCSSACQFESPGVGCDDGNLCTRQDACDGAGNCVGTATPEPVCRQPTQSGKALLVIKHSANDTHDQLIWKWSKGAMTAMADFGDPPSNTSYALCLYDQSVSPQPVFQAPVASGGICRGRPCWKPSASGFRFHDITARLQSVSLKAGDTGKARISVKGTGPTLAIPGLPLTPGITVQLKNSAGACWGADYSNPAYNTADELKATSD